MSDSEKSFHPKTEGGTTDWEAVFEVPPSGLIPLISQAQSPAALRECTIVVIKKIYTRKDDPPEVERFTSELRMMIPDDLAEDDLPRITETVTSILRQIKEDRKQKAAEFVENKKLEGAGAGGVLLAEDGGPSPQGEEKTAENPEESEERRRPGPAVRPSLRPEKSRVPLLLGLGAAVAGLAVYFFIFAPQGPEEKQPNLVLIDQMRAAARGEVAETHIFGGTLHVGVRGDRPFVTAEEIPKSACLSASWVLLNQGTIVINKKMSRRMSPSIIDKMCSSRGETAILTWFPKQDGKEKK